MSDYGNSSLNDLVQLRWYTELASVQFVWPAASDFQTASFLLPETRWQQTARGREENLPLWTEMGVWDDSGNGTYPYPGKESWYDNKTYVLQNLTLFGDDLGGVAVSRGKNYETAEYQEPETIFFDGHFPVIIDVWKSFSSRN